MIALIRIAAVVLGGCLAAAGSALAERNPPTAISPADAATAVSTDGAGAARAGGEPRASTARKPRCLWPKRDCYPPANLYYRIAVEFDGTLIDRLRGNCVPCWVATTRLKWRLESNAAVRLRLMCDDTTDSAGPFLLKRRINGERRTIGGCGRDPRGNLRTSLRFGANIGGEVTRWTHTAVVDPTESSTQRCDGYTHNTQTAPGQPLQGSVRTVGGSAKGITIDVSATGRVVPPTGSATYTCLNKITGEVTTHTRAIAPGGACCHIFGSTSWYQRGDDRVWRPITERLRFSPNAAGFGRVYEADLHSVQDEITDSPIEPPPPPGAAFLVQEQSYQYAIVLAPCANRGLDPTRCPEAEDQPGLEHFARLLIGKHK